MVLLILNVLEVHLVKEEMIPYKKNEKTRGTKAGFIKISVPVMANAVKKIRQKLLILE